MSRTLPPGWPAAVPPAGTPGWEQAATAWLLDLCPPDHRMYDVLRRYPIVLARVADGHVHAAMTACRHGLATSRADLRDQVAPEAVTGVLAMYEREGARLAAAAVSVAALTHALRGEAYIPRL